MRPTYVFQTPAGICFCFFNTFGMPILLSIAAFLDKVAPSAGADINVHGCR
jgi:hypothetical protein